MAYAPAKPRSLVVKRRALSAVEIAEGTDLQDEYPRPRRRGDCENTIRPCPYVLCQYHLYVEVKRNGNLLLPFPDKEPDELEHTCALDLAGGGPMTLDDIGAVLNLTRQQVAEIETSALARLAELVGVSPVDIEDVFSA